MHDHEFLMFEL